MTEQTDEPVTLATAVTRLAVSLAGWVAYAGAMYLTVWILKPDSRRTVIMFTARAGERVAMRNATAWAHTADVCKRAYDGARAGVTA